MSLHEFSQEKEQMAHPVGACAENTTLIDQFRMTRRALLATSAMALPYAGYAAPAKPVYRDRKAPIVLRVRDLLSRMTLDEKVAQVCSMWFGKRELIGKGGAFSSEKAKKAIPHGIGQIARPNDQVGTTGVVQAFTSPKETIAFINAVQRYLVTATRLGIPALFHEEGVHGYRGPGATVFPVPPGLASTWDPELIEQVFAVAGRETRLNGATIAFGPILDLSRDPRYGRVEEFFSEDPYLAGQIGIAAARGLQGRKRPLAKDRAFATLKHFVHGAPQSGLNISPAEMSERTLREIYLAPFAAVIKAANPASVMPSYNELEGVPSHANKALLQDAGRRRLGFKGAYFSDYDAIANLMRQHHIVADLDQAAILALKTGVDADLPNGESYSRLAPLVRANRASAAQLDAAVARILAMKFEAGLFENPYVDLSRALAQTNTQADIDLARTVAQKSLILLKNDGILPLDPDATLKLAVIGPNSVVPLLGGYSGVNDKAVGILAGIKAAAGRNINIQQADGVWITDMASPTPPYAPIHFASSKDNPARILRAVEVAKESDVILLVVGDRPDITREAVGLDAPGDRDSLDLFGDQDALVEAMIGIGKPIIALLINGRALSVRRLAEKATALLEGWYLGQEGGNAFADVLFGTVNPGGKLPVSVPKSVGQLPVFYNRHPSAEANRYIEGAHEPLFPFGFGLSYTTFDISAPRLVSAKIARKETAIVEVDVRNSGNRAGDEVVQLYIRDDVSSVPRPLLELRGFQRVSLKPGEVRTLRFKLDPDALSFWDINMNWLVEPGTFTVSVGPNSVLLKSISLTVT